MINCTFENANKASLRHVTAHAMIFKDKKLLLVKRAPGLLEAGKWGLAGGFADRDETLPEAATREAFEETGYTVHDLKLLRVIDNPNRPGEDRQNIDFLFTCKAGEQTGTPDDESTEIKWFALDDIDPQQVAFDHYDSIQIYQEVMEAGEELPGTT